MENILKIKEEVEKLIGEELIIQHVAKGNDTLIGFTFKPKGVSSINPVVYIEAFIAEYGDRAAVKIADALMLHKEDMPFQFDVDNFKNWEVAREHLKIRAVSKVSSAEYLKDKVVRELDDSDIALFCVYEVGMSNEGLGTISIKKEFLDCWGISEKELFDYALSNDGEIIVTDMYGLIVEMAGQEAVDAMFEGAPETGGMFVVSNKNKTFGASEVFYPGKLKQIANHLKSNFALLPSSVHEVIVIPFEKTDELLNLNLMVQDVNATQLAEPEILSNYAYYFDALENKLYKITEEFVKTA